MSKMKKFRARRVRHQMNAAVKHGWAAKPKHKSKSGRTGRVFAKQLQARKAHLQLSQGQAS